MLKTHSNFSLIMGCIGVLEYYFNAGVMLMNLKKIWETLDLYEEGLHLLKPHPNLSFADQDVLNILFQKKMKHLSQKFNQQINLFDETLDFSVLKQLAIFHFSGMVKAWFAPQAEVQELYHFYMAKRAYVQSVEDMVHIMSSATNLYKEKVDLKQLLLHFDSDRGIVLKIILGMKLILPEAFYWIVLS
ncbi:hypothetical protein H8J70_11185 [Megasphaera hominis]|jgi:lipopolysaccharide biosynthesis glycosyltransferase|uniref:Uncharacterized protein n=1 Tax=Megasphaera hominis TaxID=159836 RepID=A0ABR6VL39_9FIRM|nr:hypothetical protein [Megasphaera hominis]